MWSCFLEAFDIRGERIVALSLLKMGEQFFFFFYVLFVILLFDCILIPI